MTPRIFFPSDDLTALPPPESRLELHGDELHYLLRVMRAKPGDSIQLFNGRGQRCMAQLLSADKQRATLQAGIWAQGPDSQPLSIRLIQGLSATDKMDWTVEKAVELGVSEIQPAFTRRSMIRLDPARAQSKLLHWQRLAVAACRQCGRDQLPTINLPLHLDEWLRNTAATPQQRLLLSVPAGAQTVSARPAIALSEWQPDAPSASPGSPMAIDLLVGPEAGFDPQEQVDALQAGFVPIRLGHLTLRTETAGLAAVAALQLRLGTF